MVLGSYAQFCPVCGGPLDLTVQELNGQTFILHTCWRPTCHVFGRTCSLIDLSDKKILALWETEVHFNTANGVALDGGSDASPFWCISRTYTRLVGRDYPTYQLIRGGDPLDVAALIRDDDSGQVIFYHSIESAAAALKELLQAAASEWSNSFEVRM